MTLVLRYARLRGHTLNRLFLQPVPLRSPGSGPGRGQPSPGPPGPRPGALPPSPAFRLPRPLTRSSSARSPAGRMRWPRQRPPSSVQAAHTGRRSEQQNHLRAWPCSGQRGPGSGPGPGPGPGTGPALSADMAERPAGAARSTCRRCGLGGASLTPPRPNGRPRGLPPRAHRSAGACPAPLTGPWPRSHPLQQSLPPLPPPPPLGIKLRYMRDCFPTNMKHQLLM